MEEPVEEPVEDEGFCFDDENTFAVEKITQKCILDGVPHYWIKWWGFPESYNSWEPKKNVSAYALKVYEAEKKKAAASSRPMTAAEALATAKAEGLELPRGASWGSSGYRYVLSERNRRRAFRAEIGGGKGHGHRIKFGCFHTAEEAALVVARFLKSQNPPHGVMSKAIKKRSAGVQRAVQRAVRKREARKREAAEREATKDAAETAAEKLAIEAAEAEGLTLLQSDNSTGFKGVWYEPATKRRSGRYRAQVYIPVKGNFGEHSRCDVRLGAFDSAATAALAIARYKQSAEYAEVTAPPNPPTPHVSRAARKRATKKRNREKFIENRRVRTARKKAWAAAAKVEEARRVAEAGELARVGAAEAIKAAEAEGLTLLEADDNRSGFKGVSFSEKGRKYMAQVWIPANENRGGYAVALGRFDAAEMAALAIARYKQSEEYAEAMASTTRRASQESALPEGDVAQILLQIHGREHTEAA